MPGESRRRCMGWLLAALAAAGVAGLAFVARAEEFGESDAVDKEEVVTEKGGVPEGFTIRARVVSMVPPAKAIRFRWRYGGEGLGGDVVSGIIGESGKPEMFGQLNGLQAPPPEEFQKVSGGSLAEFEAVDKLIRDLGVGEWSPYAAVSSMGGGGFRTFTLEGDAGKARNTVFEFEFSYKGKVVKTFQETAPDGTTATILIPSGIVKNGKIDDAQLARLESLSQYVKNRADNLESLPYSKWPRPRLFAIVTDCGGYGMGQGYGVRHNSQAIIQDEMRSLQCLGVNGFRGGFGRLSNVDPTLADSFHRAALGRSMGYPVAQAPEQAAAGTVVPEQGCPYGAGVPDRTRMAVAGALNNLKIDVQEVWGLTHDEIGPVGGAPEGRKHLTYCPACVKGFQDYVQLMGCKPEDFGKKFMLEVKPYPIFGKLQPPAPPENAGPYAPPPAEEEPDRPSIKDDPNEALAAYYTVKFLNYSSGKLFHEVGAAYEKANDAKRSALAAGKTDSPEARQPWLYSYALRGNTFLMGGSSLDFFDFYRYGDNGFMYETSNRDARIWNWDSYLCDVGRTLSTRMGKGFGIYVKPHRGAPVQRALSAVSRNARVLYWYTYGPDYVKGDGFAYKPWVVELVAKAAGLIGKTENVLWNSQWSRPAEVALVRPETARVWWSLGGNPAGAASWEDSKWVYTALQHAHVPVDALDEKCVDELDLSQYKVIYVTGSHIPKKTAEKLAQWVQAGGTLYTCGWGLVADERNQPLDCLKPVLGLEKRNQPEQWNKVPVYGATSIGNFSNNEPPAGTAVTGSQPFSGTFQPVVGREVLLPSPTTEVLAKYADGSAAITRNKCGKGEAWVVGMFPGLEYSAAIRKASFDASKDYDPGLRTYVSAAALAHVQPVVDASQPTIEGVLLKNKDSGKQAVTLMNWTYRGKGLVPFTDVKITIRGAGKVSKVVSAMTDKELALTRDGEAVTVTLPEIQEGDVLLLE